MAERMIPPGYMTVGEVAKKMGVTVRTLQYYDREGLLSPSAESEGGRRLYADKDVIKLHQILSLKHLGFSLDDIKNRLTALDTPAQVAQALAQQAAEIRGKMDALAESLRELEMLRAEVLQMQTVNFKKYADIIVNLQMKNDFYWIIKHFDDQTLEHIRGRFDRESGLDFLGRFNGLCGEVLRLQQDGIPPDSEAGRDVAKRFIGIEQLDYIEETAVQRLQAVMGGERHGISRAEAWKGGGSFVYCELAEQNGFYVNREEAEEAELSWEDLAFTKNFYEVEE